MQRQMRRHIQKSRHLQLVVASILAIGCSPTFDTTKGKSVSSLGSVTIDGLSGGGIGSGDGIVPDFKMNCALPVAKENSGKLRYKTVGEYVNFIEIAFSLSEPVMARKDISFRGLDSFSYEASLLVSRDIDAETFRLISDIAAKGAEMLLQKKSSTFKCAANNFECLMSFVAGVAGEFGIALSDASKAALKSIYMSHADSAEGARTLLRAFMMSPEALSENKAQNEQQFVAEKLASSIWGQVPDKELRDIVKSGQLANKDVLKAQIQRMLKDPRSQYLSDAFLNSWLGLHDLNTVEAVKSGLPADYVKETQELFRHLVAEDGNLMDLLSADYTFVNAKLAAFYGIAGTFPEDRYVKATLPNSAGRKGILGHVGVLIANAGSAVETHPVTRGLYILNQISCVQVPPPPDNINSSLEDNVALKDLTPREKIERHSSDPSCAGCHKIFDPMGFALEGFDQFGKYRTTYPSGKPVDSATAFVTGEPMASLPELVDVVAKSGRFQTCFAEHMIEYLANRPVVNEDRCVAKAVSDRVFAEGGKISDLFYYLAQTPQARMVTAQEK